MKKPEFTSHPTYSEEKVFRIDGKQVEFCSILKLNDKDKCGEWTSFEEIADDICFLPGFFSRKWHRFGTSDEEYLKVQKKHVDGKIKLFTVNQGKALLSGDIVVANYLDMHPEKLLNHPLYPLYIDTEMYEEKRRIMNEIISDINEELILDKLSSTEEYKETVSNYMRNRKKQGY